MRERSLGVLHLTAAGCLECEGERGREREMKGEREGGGGEREEGERGGKHV